MTCRTNNLDGLRGLLSFSNYCAREDTEAMSDTTLASMDHLTIIGGVHNLDTSRAQINASDQQPTTRSILLEEAAPLNTTQALEGQKVGRESIMESLYTSCLTR